MTLAPQPIMQLLTEWGNGKQGTVDRMMPIGHAELHRIAKRQQNHGHILQTTVLRLAGDSGKDWQSRAHFFTVAATATRHVLVDYARGSHSAKWGGARPR